MSEMKNLRPYKAEESLYVAIRSVNWASEASPTLGCSIEISRDLCVSVVVQKA